MSASSVDRKVAAAIGSLSELAAASGPNAEWRDAARRTNGAPVYADLCGVLVVMADGSVARFDPEMDGVAEVHDEAWIAVALCRASQRYPELESLLPARPLSAVTFPQCDGAGIVLDSLDCGKCFSLGWVRGRSDSQRWQRKRTRIATCSQRSRIRTKHVVSRLLIIAWECWSRVCRSQTRRGRTDGATEIFMTTPIDRAVACWRSQSGLRLRRGLKPAMIRTLCAQRGIEIPSSLSQLVEAVDGFDAAGDQDERGFSFWPLERMERVDVFDGGVHRFPGSHWYLLFCDYLVWSWAYAIRIEGPPESIGSIVIVGTADGTPIHVAASLDEFLEAYCDDKPALYVGATSQQAGR